jgi:putative membrane protein
MDTATKLAFERTYLANERTQMVWIRTSLALISFGFTIAHLPRILHAVHAAKALVLALLQ